MIGLVNLILLDIRRHTMSKTRGDIERQNHKMTNAPTVQSQFLIYTEETLVEEDKHC